MILDSPYIYNTNLLTFDKSTDFYVIETSN